MGDQSIYQLGRSTDTLAEPFRGDDKVYGGQRLDGKTIKDAIFQHCTFGNISFKGVIFRNDSFLNCIFIGCYFRRADLGNTRFVGCRFFDCVFSHVTIKGCDFRFSTFRDCQIPFAEMRYSLPSEPNIREELARNLALESSRLGLALESRVYRMEEIRAREEHLLAAVRGSSQWYRDHYDFFARLQAFVNWSFSLLNRWLWGYGERARVLLRNLALMAFLVFPTSFYLLRSQLRRTDFEELSVPDFIFFSLGNIMPAGVVPGVVATGTATRLLAGFESLIGVIALALFASYIFRWSLHR